jgi:8-oxo-dGTP pyrophosphatase MutT (NUDIX family)
VKRTFDFDWFKVKWLPGYGWIVDRPAAVVTMPIAPDDRVWLARIKRIPTGATSWEFPGGMIDRGETIASAGLRELEEECGLMAKGPVRVLPKARELAPGMGRFPHHFVIASDVVPKGRNAVPQRDEGILAVRKFDRAHIRKMLLRGQIHVHPTIAALTLSGWLDEPRPTHR